MAATVSDNVTVAENVVVQLGTPPDTAYNFGYSTVATAPSPATSGTSLTVASGDGILLFAQPSFNCTVWPAGARPTSANSEIVRVTARNNDILTIARAQEGSTARSIVVGDQIALTNTARAENDPGTTYAFYVYRAAALNSSNSATVVAMDTKVYDIGSNVDVVTNKGRFTAPVGGIYWFSGACGNTLATGVFEVQLYKNGGQALVGTLINESNTGNIYSVSGSLQLATGDYVELNFVGGNGSVMYVGSALCYFQGFLLRKLY